MNYLTEQFSLSGKTALVTGGARGIGSMIAKALLQAGAKVYITSRKPEDLEQQVEEFNKIGSCVGMKPM